MTEKEKRKIKNYLIRTVARTLPDIKSWSGAEKRVNALFQSGMLTEINYNPDNILHQKAIEIFLRFPFEEVIKKDYERSIKMFKEELFEAFSKDGEPINVAS